MTLLILLAPMHRFRTNTLLLIGTPLLFIFALGLGRWVHAMHFVGFFAELAAPGGVVAVVFAVVVLCICFPTNISINLGDGLGEEGRGRGKAYRIHTNDPYLLNNAVFLPKEIAAQAS
jgi:hypothetical protein